MLGKHAFKEFRLIYAKQIKDNIELDKKFSYGDSIYTCFISRRSQNIIIRLRINEVSRITRNRILLKNTFTNECVMDNDENVLQNSVIPNSIKHRFIPNIKRKHLIKYDKNNKNIGIKRTWLRNPKSSISLQIENRKLRKLIFS